MRFQFTHSPCDDWGNIYTLSCYRHQIGSMNYYPLFRVRSWNNGVRCMSFYILMGLTRGRQDPGEPHVGHTKLAIGLGLWSVTASRGFILMSLLIHVLNSVLVHIITVNKKIPDFWPRPKGWKERHEIVTDLYQNFLSKSNLCIVVKFSNCFPMRSNPIIDQMNYDLIWYYRFMF